MSKSQKRELIIIIIGALLLACAVIGTELLETIPELAVALAYIAPYLLLGFAVMRSAVVKLFSGDFMDENFLMTVASIGAICIGEYPEAVLVMLLYRIGELLQGIAVGRSRKSIAALMDICPDHANLETQDGIVSVTPEEVKSGDIVVVRPGERIPLDATVIEGISSLNTAAITGESLPRDVSTGDTVMSGCINLQGVLRLRVDKEYGASTVSRMLELIENASDNKAKSENFITKFARWYTPSVVAIAALLALIPPLVFKAGWSDWIYRALTFLVVSCPCALVISVPLTFFGGIGGASKRGILIKGSNYIETLAKCDVFVFDKTGTLTEGRIKVTKLNAAGISEAELLRITACAERYSSHPIAQAIRAAYGEDELKDANVTDVEELAGLGLKAVVDGAVVYAGNIDLMHSNGISCQEAEQPGTAIYVGVNGKFIGSIIMTDAIKADAADAVARLKAEGVRETVMLTGDRSAIAGETAASIGIDRFHAQLLPQDKVSILEKLIAERTGKKSKIAFVGDGINDAPVLSRADLGIAMGGLGSDAAIEASDVVITDDNLLKLPEAVRIARRTVSIAAQNIVFALAVKLIVMLLAACNVAAMWMALVADVGVCLIAIINAMRTLKPQKAKVR